MLQCDISRFVGRAISDVLLVGRQAEDRRANQADIPREKVRQPYAGDTLVIGGLLLGRRQHVSAAQCVVGEIQMCVHDQHLVLLVPGDHPMSPIR